MGVMIKDIDIDYVEDTAMHRLDKILDERRELLIDYLVNKKIEKNYYMWMPHWFRKKPSKDYIHNIRGEVIDFLNENGYEKTRQEIIDNMMEPSVFHLLYEHEDISWAWRYEDQKQRLFNLLVLCTTFKKQGIKTITLTDPELFDIW